MPNPSSSEQLASTLRSAASRIADLADGGGTLIFARLPGDGEDAASSPELLAAAGFETAEEARAAAGSLDEAILAALSDPTPQQIDEPPGELGPRSSAGVRVVPLACDGRVHGAIAVTFPQPPEERVTQQIDQLAASAALHVDHGHLAHQNSTLLQRVESGEPDGKSDELLKLSEELFAQDIELLRSNEKLGKIEKLKNDFIEKMSRELRTPLNSIIEAIISVLAGENESLSDGAKQSLRVALDEGTAFGRTLQSIVELWRIKQGELPLESMEVNFTEVVEEAIFSVQDTLGSKPVEIVKNFPEPLPKVRTDLGKVNQLLFLLLENAAKFTETGQIVIHAVVRDQTLVCEVRDTGIGICPDDQESIFEEFFQVDDFGASTYRGAGLGLTLFRDLVLLLQGEVELQSEPGKGTCFTFEIPVEVV